MLDTGSGEVGSEEAVSSDGGGCPVVTGMRQRNTSEDCLPGRDLERLTPSFPTRRVGGLKAGEAEGGIVDSVSSFQRWCCVCGTSKMGLLP